MGETVVRLYEDRDAEGVAKLFARNNFFFPREVSGDEYRRISALRGLALAVVAEKDGEIVAHLSAVRTGRMKSFRPHQLYTGNLIIDRSFRTHMYSLSDMQRLMIRTIRCRLPEITDFISDVEENNLPSMYLQRQTGAALIEWAPDLDGYVEFHNFAINLPNLFRVMNTEKGLYDSGYRSLVPFKKSEYNKANELIDGRLLRSEYAMYSKRFAVWNNIYSGYICRYEILDSGLVAGLEGGGRTLRLLNGGGEEAAWHITALDDGGKSLFEADCPLPRGAEQAFPLPPEANLVRLDLSNTDLTFCLYPEEDWLEDPYLDRREGIALGGGALVNAQTGALHIGGVRREDHVLSLTWPVFETPFSQGPLLPNTWQNLSAEGNEGGATIRQMLDGCQVIRDYALLPDGCSVRMRVVRDAMNAPQERLPLIGFFLEDPEGTLSVKAGDREILNRGLDNRRDHDRCGSRSLYFINFMNEPYSREIVSSATFHTRRGSYQITADRPFTVLFQYGYLRLRYLKAEEAEGGVDIDAPEIDFGSIMIRKV